MKALVVVYPEKEGVHLVYVVESTTVRDPRLYAGARLSSDTVVELVMKDIVVLVHKEGGML